MTAEKRKQMWLKAAIFSLLIVLAAAAGIFTRLQQTKDDVPEKPATGLPTAVTDLERLRDSGDQSAFNTKLQATLADPALDDQTRYLVYVEQGHFAMQNQEAQAAVDAYLKAWQVEQNKQVAALLGDAYAALGNKEKATEFYNRAIGLIPAGYPRHDALKQEYQDRIKALDEGGQQ